MMGSAHKRLTRQLVAAIGQPNAQLAVPEAGRLLWRAFLALSRTRSYSGFGPNPISYLEIEAWCRLNRTPLQPHHIDAITAMDQEWLKGGSNGEPPIMTNLTPTLFDAAFG